MTGIDSPVSIDSLATALPDTKTASHSTMYPDFNNIKYKQISLKKRCILLGRLVLSLKTKKKETQENCASCHSDDEDNLVWHFLPKCTKHEKI